MNYRNINHEHMTIALAAVYERHAKLITVVINAENWVTVQNQDDGQDELKHHIAEVGAKSE